MQRQTIFALFICSAIAVGFSFYALNSSEDYQFGITEAVDRDLTNTKGKEYEAKLSTLNSTLTETLTDDERFEFLRDKGEVLASLGKLGESSQAYRDAIKYNKDIAATYSELFEVQLEMNDYEGAKKSITTALELKPNSLRWRRYIDLMFNYMHYGPDIVNGLYTQALAQEADNLNLATDYARYQEKLGNLAIAKEYWQKAIVLDPDDKVEYDAEIASLDAKINP